MQSKYHENEIKMKQWIFRDNTMADKLMCIPNDYKQNYLFCGLQLVKSLDTKTNQ